MLGCGEPSRADDSRGGAPNDPSSKGGATAGGSSPSSPAGGAGSSVEHARYFEPGSRLKPKVLAWEDGVDIIEEQNGGWYDSQLEFDCVFYPDDAGVERATLPASNRHPCSVQNLDVSPPP